MIFGNKVGTLFVNLFQLTDETINGTVTSVFVCQTMEHMQTKSDLHQSTLQIMTSARTACNDTKISVCQTPFTPYLGVDGWMIAICERITNRAPVHSFKLDQYPTELQL